MSAGITIINRPTVAAICREEFKRMYETWCHYRGLKVV